MHSTEVGVVGWGCAAADGVHLNERDFAVEAIGMDSERKFEAGELGELVVTSSRRAQHTARSAIGRATWCG